MFVFHIDLVNAIWLFAILFMIHDFEEIITVEHWSPRAEKRIHASEKKLHAFIWRFWNVNSHGFAKRDVVIFMVMSAIVFSRVQFPDSSWISGLFIGFLLFVLLHNVLHVAQSLILKMYTPGLYTAIILVTPYVMYLLYRLQVV